ncbi:TldD/PmbA family protein [Desulfurococcaceae archaeon MEX13E-LK6-19]|nr:TldD/PmbA family protein [Desulfurococcaceae archaeon MEX13E-LK6-19]
MSSLISRELNIYDTAVVALRKAMQKGVDEAEVFIVKTKSINTDINNNRITGSYMVTETGVGIRVVVGKRIGFASTNKIDINSLEKTIEQAISIARASEPDEHWPGFPQPADYKIPEKIYNPELARVSEETIIEKTKLMLEKFLEDKRIVVVWGSLSVGVSTVAIANSNGVANVEHATTAVIGAGIVARTGSDVTPVVYDYNLSRVSLPPIEPLVEKLKDLAVNSLKPIKIEQKKMPVILYPIAVDELLSYTLAEAISGDNVVRGRSILAGKVGQQVFSEKLTIIDNGLLKHGWYTGIFDGEGVPMQETIVIEKGVVKNFLFDTYWAARYGGESTGNAGRQGYRSTPAITPTNLVIKPGDMSSHEIIAETKQGLLVYGLQGAHSSNPETGEFSAVATPAWYIENGVLKPVRGVMISGNIYECLKKLEYISKDYEQKGHWVAPYIRLEEVNVIPRC